MELEPRPPVNPKQDVWEYCDRLSKKYNISSLEILNRFIKIGREIVEREEAGEKVIIRGNGKQVEIIAFGVNTNKNKTEEKVGAK